jgi:BON domain
MGVYVIERKSSAPKGAETQRFNGPNREEKITSMRKIKSTVLTLSAALLLTAVPALAQRSTTVEVTNPQLAKRVRHELVTLPYYGVFDNLAYNINGGTVTLYGQVVRPTTRSGAENRVKRLPGVSRVVNNIEVLPLSGFDDNIRVATYRSIARTGGLSRYLRGVNPSIHIVVDRGHVALEGVVANNSDRILANMAARQVSGTFSVTNNLRVEGERSIG